MAPSTSAVVALLVDALGVARDDLGALGLAWARVAPTVALVPGFGLRALPTAARAALGLCLALAVAPALRLTVENGARPWAVELVVQAALGLPVALSAATALWVATQVGGIADELRGARDQSQLPNLESGTSPLGALFGLLAGIAFLESGGPARVAHALSEPSPAFSAPLARAAAGLARGVELSLAIAAPLVATALVVELGSTLVARAANPAQLGSLLSPLKTLALLATLALALDRMLALVVALVAA